MLHGSLELPRGPPSDGLEASGYRRPRTRAAAPARAASIQIRRPPGQRPRTRSAQAGSQGPRASTRHRRRRRRACRADQPRSPRQYPAPPYRPSEIGRERSSERRPERMIRSAMPSPWQAVEAGTDLLARARQIQSSWDLLLGEGGLGAELPPQATAGMRPTIVESWRRGLVTGLDPTDLMPSIEADRSETQERWLEHPLGSLRHVLVEQLQRWAQESNSLVQVTDPSGLTLYLGGPDWLKERAAEMNLVEGGRCSETVNGTNGVGTALAVDHPVQVFAFEHFSHHHREWVCSGAPIHDRVSGRLVGVIDLSSPWRIAHPRSLELVTAAARTTEQCLRAGRRDRDARLRRRYGDLMRKTSDLLVNRDGYLLIGDDLAHPKPLDIPENGGEIAMGDGSLAVAEPLGRGEAYLVRRPGSRHARAARAEALERAEERAAEVD